MKQNYYSNSLSSRKLYFEEMKNTLIHNCIASYTNCQVCFYIFTPLQAESSRISQLRTQQADWELPPARAVRGGDAVRAGRAHLQRGHCRGAALQVLQQALIYLWTPCLLLFGPRRRGNWET